MNTIYGWGKEDDSLINRLLNNGIDKVLYPKLGQIIDFEEITINEKIKSVKMNNIAYEKLCEDMISWNSNGLNSLNYKIIANLILLKELNYLELYKKIIFN